MDDLTLKPWAQEFLAGHMFCTVSSVSSTGVPQAAYVGFSCNDSFEFLIGTSKLSRKYRNITANNAVALVVADLSGEMQFEGTATEIDDAEYNRLIANEGFGALPGYDLYRNNPDQIFFKISPTWIRLINHKEQNKTEEYNA